MQGRASTAQRASLALRPGPEEPLSSSQRGPGSPSHPAAWSRSLISQGLTGSQTVPFGGAARGPRGTLSPGSRGPFSAQPQTH